MEVQRGVGHVVEAVGGGGQSRAGFHHQAQRFSPFIGAQWRGAGLTRRAQDASRV